ncbi:acyl-CoA dehydrogenase [Rugosimonospora africana]|uniref:acyl-CoA dehydrogenase n=1 Tax=Rugosimonospora africana TaxID=556532 RepID=UPI0019434D5C|nr:acyl-CoA dehydrogenase [Rugosimonospora africana]
MASYDLTVAIAHGKTFLGGASVWVAGDIDQARWLAAAIGKDSVVSWGLTERNHGADLLASEVTAVRTGTGWRLNGEKWLINNATRGDIICVLARTKAAGGPRGFSLFLVDKHSLPADRYRYCPKVRTHGIRGADISGIGFDDVDLPETALVGGAGEGIEIVLKALQLTRTACTALSLGATDHALRIVGDFVQERQLYGRQLVEFPRVRRIFGEVCAASLVIDAVSVVAGRSIQNLTEELSVVSAVSKAFVPTVAQEMIGKLGELLGARGFLTDVYAAGAFAKLDRDHRVVGIFDGSTVVNRNALIDQFANLSRAYHRGQVDEQGLSDTASLEHPSPDLDPKQLALLSKTGCSLIQSLPRAAEEVRDLAAGAGRIPQHVVHMVDELEEIVTDLHREMTAHRRLPQRVPAEAFELAERYEVCFAAASCLHLWLRSESAVANISHVRDSMLWLQACLTWTLTRLGAVSVADGGAGVYDALADAMTRLPDRPGTTAAPSRSEACFS